MNKSIELLRKTNETFVNMMDDLSAEQLNKIPDGFNNNLIWNFAHTIAVQQDFFYGLSGISYTLDKAFIKAYRKGTKPQGFVTESEIKEIKQMFISAINQFETDYSNNQFINYQSYTTSVGYVITNIDEAIQVASFHDGWHFGYARTIKKLVLGV